MRCGPLGQSRRCEERSPPTEKVQQLVCLTFQSAIRPAAEGLVIEILVDPDHLASARRDEDAIRTARLVRGWLGNDRNVLARQPAAVPGIGAHRRPLSTQKRFGSWPSGRETLPAWTPCSLSWQASDCAACWPLPLVSASKAR